MFYHSAATVSQEIPKTCSEEKITIDLEGQKYSATYTVDGGIVNVMMKNEDGTFMGTSTFADGSTTDSVARSLFCELLRDVGIF